MPKHDPGQDFRALHVPGQPFILANVWDLGSAKVLEALGAKALGTSSAAHAFTLGRPDMGNITRDEALSHAQEIVAATNLPVSGDFENGFADDPQGVAETIRLAAATGLAGCSIEDTALPGTDAYPFDLALERVQACVAAARALPSDFVFVARADGVMNGAYGMEEAIRRIRAFDEAGADCVYVPLPPDMDALRQVVSSTNRPVNALAAGSFTKVAYSEYASAGIARISLGSSLARATHKVTVDAAKAMLSDGDFSKLGGVSGDYIDAMLSIGKADRTN